MLGLRLKRALTLTERELIESFASQIALLIERERLLGDAERARIDEKSARLQKTLLDSVSHEFRTPLAVISGAAEALEKKSRRHARPHGGNPHRAGERLHRVVGNLLDITRIETGAIHPKAEWCDLEEIVSGAVARVGGELGGRRVDIQISPEAAVVRTDSGLVEEMLANLLRNAAQAGGRGAIRVTAAHRNSQLKLSVLDEGPGLGDGARVFEKFYRRRKFASLRTWARALDREGIRGGARRKRERREPDRRAAWRGVRDSASRARAFGGGSLARAMTSILIIDDEPQIRRLLRVILEAGEYKVLEAETGELGLVEAASRLPDAIILDLGLPDISGIDVLARLREWTRIPILILSVRDSEQDKVLALDKGADDYVTKPFHAGEILARLRAVLRRGSANNEPVVEAGALRMDLSAHTAWVGREPVELTPTEYSLLRVLAPERGQDRHAQAPPRRGVGPERRRALAIPPRLHEPHPQEARRTRIPGEGAAHRDGNRLSPAAGGLCIIIASRRQIKSGG